MSTRSEQGKENRATSPMSDFDVHGELSGGEDRAPRVDGLGVG